MSIEFEYKKPERAYLCDFSIEEYVYDSDLPLKIRDKLTFLNISFAPDKTYCLDVSFDVGVYKDKQLFAFPVERKPWQLERLKNQKPQERVHTMISDVLSQQLENICIELSGFSFKYSNATIAGEDFGNLRRVDFCIYEDPYPMPEVKPTGKKRKPSQTQFVAYNIIPHRPSTVKRMVELLAEQAAQKISEAQTKELEIASHTPNMVKVDKLFTTIASASLAENPREFSSTESLAYEMVAHAVVKNDWPVEITGDQGVFPEENGLEFYGEIDCPEYLIFVQKNKYWTLKKIRDLDMAKYIILHDGFNQKTTKEIVVLQNLEPVLYRLYSEHDGEITPISKAEAHLAKKIFLSWKKGDSHGE